MPVLLTTGAFSAASLIAAFKIFSPQSIAGWAVVVIGTIGTIYGARAYGRQRAGEVWQHTSEGWQQRAELMEKERALVEKDRDEQRTLKHAARAELAAEKLKRDLTPVLAALQAITETQGRQLKLLERLVERPIQSTLKAITETQAHQQQLLELLVDRLAPPTTPT